MNIFTGDFHAKHWGGEQNMCHGNSEALCQWRHNPPHFHDHTPPHKEDLHLFQATTATLKNTTTNVPFDG